MLYMVTPNDFLTALFYFSMFFPSTLFLFLRMTTPPLFYLLHTDFLLFLLFLSQLSCCLDGCRDG